MEFAASVAELRTAIVAEYEAEVRRAQRRAFGFCVDVAASTAGADAGAGVFVRGHARLGSVVAVYPGVVYTKHDLLRLPTDFLKTLQGNDRLFLRMDGTLLDASARSVALVPAAGACCPLSVGHRVNHPPAGQTANVLTCAVDLDPLTLPQRLHHLLPNVRCAGMEMALLSASGGGSGAPKRPMDTLVDMLRFSLSEVGAAEAGDENAPIRSLVRRALPARSGRGQHMRTPQASPVAAGKPWREADRDAARSLRAPSAAAALRAPPLRCWWPRATWRTRRSSSTTGSTRRRAQHGPAGTCRSSRRRPSAAGPHDLRPHLRLRIVAAEAAPICIKKRDRPPR